MIKVSRRRFLALTGGMFATGCAGSPASTSSSPASTSATASTPASTPASTSATTTPTVVTAVTGSDVGADGHVLLVIELRGGNDALNTMVPLVGAYRDARPTLAISENNLVAMTGFDGYGMHPALAPIATLAESGRLAAVAGIGFSNPDRSHFVSTDRWARADRLDQTVGWLGRWLDALPDEPDPFTAAALGELGEVASGATRTATAIGNIDAFALPPLVSNASIRLLGDDPSDDPLIAAAQRAFANSVGALEEFDVIADAVRSRVAPRTDDELGVADGAFSTGLAIAAELILGGVGTRIVTISVDGFDTHSDQLVRHQSLLTDLASGLSRFWATIDEAGAGDRVLAITTSEFGRRVAENASAGCDHGAAGVSFVMGGSVPPGVHGALDLSALLDGDLRPQIDPRALFTTSLDWLGADVERILGQRYDGLF